MSRAWLRRAARQRHPCGCLIVEFCAVDGACAPCIDRLLPRRTARLQPGLSVPHNQGGLGCQLQPALPAGDGPRAPDSSHLGIWRQPAHIQVDGGAACMLAWCVDAAGAVGCRRCCLGRTPGGAWYHCGAAVLTTAHHRLPCSNTIDTGSGLLNMPCVTSTTIQRQCPGNGYYNLVDAAMANASVCAALSPASVTPGGCYKDDKCWFSQPLTGRSMAAASLGHDTLQHTRAPAHSWSTASSQSCPRQPAACPTTLVPASTPAPQLSKSNGTYLQGAMARAWIQASSGSPTSASRRFLAHRCPPTARSKPTGHSRRQAASPSPEHLHA